MLPKITKPKKIIYLDNAAATPLDPLVKKAMEPFWNVNFGNPSSLHAQGREAKAAVEQSRKTIAGLINARPSEIVFTAGGTESVNLAIFGVAQINTDLKTNKHKSPLHFITSAIEHHCVINSLKALEQRGHKTTFVKVDGQGVIDINQLKKAVRPETVLISVMLANNEIGTIEPIAEIGKWLKQINADRMQRGLARILFHTDACQAPGFLDLNVDKLGVDLMSVNGSKIYGPKQTGFLYVRSGIALSPLVYGGGQERDLRSGTENVPGIVGLAKAFELGFKQRLKESERLFKLSDYAIKKILKQIPQAILNSPKINRLPNNINISFNGLEGEALMLYLDSYGIAVSTSSACSTGTTDASHVLVAIGRSPKEAKSGIRISLGKFTTKPEIDYLIKILPNIVSELRKVKNII